jgi:hypothetical protein
VLEPQTAGHKRARHATAPQRKEGNQALGIAWKGDATIAVDDLELPEQVEPRTRSNTDHAVHHPRPNCSPLVLWGGFARARESVRTAMALARLSRLSMPPTVQVVRSGPSHTSGL